VSTPPEPGRRRWPYEWALVRVVPRIDRGEFVNAGVLLHSHPLELLLSSCALDVHRLRALDPDVDLAAVQRHLTAVEATCAGDPAAGPVARLSVAERFRWLTAPRSTMVQTSAVHTGLSVDPASEVDRLLERLVLAQ
jgi:hypothetical protein